MKQFLLLFVFLTMAFPLFVFCQQIETIKILAGETLSMECPKTSPTWFYRSSEKNNEDLIVTRHGVVNVEYKQKITSHSILKHKIIFINKISPFDDGIYSCLYAKSLQNEGEDVAIMQERHMFNVSVYSKFACNNVCNIVFFF